ncbi:hypothetical protein [Sorangium sp. So ce1000]|uniref:hypothetical protein n=1 Tax=Sorangium sp. So ce1000 TaxID=3133325 RepID=UPI003F5F847F
MARVATLLVRCGEGEKGTMRTRSRRIPWAVLVVPRLVVVPTQTEEVANRMDYDLPPGIFCGRFIDQTRATFISRYKGFGARVTNP